MNTNTQKMNQIILGNRVMSDTGKKLRWALILSSGVISALIIALICSLQAQAMMLELSLADLSSGADSIVTGTVLNISCQWDGVHKNINTSVLISVEEVLKGSLTIGDQVSITVPGGTIDGLTEYVSDTPIFNVGERSVVFLKQKNLSQTEVYGLAQGKYAVVQGKVNGRPLAEFESQIFRSIGNYAEPSHTGEYRETGPYKGVNMTEINSASADQSEVISASSAQTVFSDGFEGTFPGTNWHLYGSSTSWGKNSSTSHTGSYSVWCAGSSLSPPSNYPSNVHTLMVAGPFNLSNATTADLNFYVRMKLQLPTSEDPSTGDVFGVWASTTPGTSDLWGYWMSSQQDSWQSKDYDLTNWYHFGNLCGQSSVYFAFSFDSNSDSVTDKGVFLDDIQITKSSSIRPSISGISPSQASAGTGTNITINGSNFGTSTGSVNFFYQESQPKISGTIISWSDTSIQVIVPVGTINGYAASAGSGPVTVKTADGAESAGFPFTVTFSYGGVKWAGNNPVLNYYVNPNTADCTGEEVAFQQAAHSWNNIPGKSLIFHYSGATPKTTVGQDGEDDIIWGTMSNNGIIAQTSVWDPAPGSIITEVDIVFNDYYNWSTAASVSSDRMDVQTIATHELGHWLNLRDLYGNVSGYPQDSAKVMYGWCDDGVNKRILQPEDIAGMQWIYPGTTVDHLRIDTQPSSNLSVDSPFTASAVITALDSSNNPIKLVNIIADRDPVTGTGTLRGTLTAITNDNGQAIFNNLAYNKTDAFKIRFTCSDKTIISNQVGPLSAGAPSAISIFTIPVAGASVDANLATQPAILVADQFNNPVGGINVTVSRGTGTGTLRGTLTATSGATGLATFTDLGYNKSGEAFTLHFTAGSLFTDSASLGPLPAGAPARLAFATQPAGAVASSPFTVQPVVTIKDTYSNPTTNSGAAVTLAITTGTGTNGAVLSGPNPILAVNGVATFSGLGINLAGKGYTLTASGNSLASATSDLFNVSNAASSTSLTSSIRPSIYGQAVAFTAAVNPVSPATGTPTGSVTFKDGTSTLGTETLKLGQATYNTSDLLAGNHTIFAMYQGDDNFNASSGSLTQTVNKGSSIIAIASSVNPSVYGQLATFNTTVSAVLPATSTPSGAVTLKDGSNTLGTGSLDTSGQATWNITALSVGSSHSITAVYAGDANFNGSTSTAVTQTVSQGSSSTAMTSSANLSTYGQSVIFTAAVNAVPPASGTPSGTVTFKEGTGTLGTGTLVSGQSTYSTSILPAGSHSITAFYSGDINFTPSSSLTFNQTVNKASSATAMTSSSNPSTHGQTVTLTATVRAIAPATSISTGMVTFKDGDAVLGNGPLNTSGTITYVASNLPAGIHNLSAVYGGDANYNGSISPVLVQTVNKISTTAGVTSSANPSIYSESVTFTATVSAASTTPTKPSGTVTFQDGTSVLETDNLSSSGKATYTSPFPTTGSHSISAIYNGDNNFTTSTSPALIQTVDKFSPAILITPSASPSLQGESVTFNVTVSNTISMILTDGMGSMDRAEFGGGGGGGGGAAGGGGGKAIPTGTVALKEGTSLLGAWNLSSSGQVDCSISDLSLGDHFITFNYSGDANFKTNLYPFEHKVNPFASNMNGVSSVNPSAYGQPVTFNVTVAAVQPENGTPTGTVILKDGSPYLSSPQMLDKSILAVDVQLNNGAATWNTSALSAGNHTIYAIYSGDATKFAASTWNTTQIVNKGLTTTALISSPNPSNYGQLVTFNVTVNSVSTTTITPAGTVTLKDGTSELGTWNLSSGQAICTTSTLSTGSHSIISVYNGDTNYDTSTSPILPQTVNKGTTNIIVTSSANPSASGQSITFAATVSALSTASSEPTGSVTFIDGATGLGTWNLSSSGQATCTLSLVNLGGHSITAAYSGDVNYDSSTSAALAQKAVQYSSTTTITSSPDPSTYGQLVTFNVTVSAVLPSTGIPTGTVTFKDGTSELGTGNLDASGKATWNTTTLSADSHTLSAYYTGDDNFAVSTANFTQTVNMADTTTSISSSANPSSQNQSVTLTASISGNGPVSGTVDFKDGATIIGTGTLNASGQATFATSPLTAGNYTLSAAYNGDSNHNASYSSPLSQTVSGGGGGGGGGGGAPSTTTVATDILGSHPSLKLYSNGAVVAALKASSPDGKLDISLPAGTLALLAGKPITTFSVTTGNSPAAPPAGTIMISPTYGFGPAGATFNPPFSLVYHFSTDLIPAGVEKTDLYLAYYDTQTSTWMPLSGVVDASNNTLTGAIANSTSLAVFAPTAPSFTLSGLEVLPAQVVAGNKVTITVTLTNSGGKAGSYPVALNINASVEQSSTVNVSAGGSQKVTFQVTRQQPGKYTVKVGELTTSFTVIAPEPSSTPTPAPAPPPPTPTSTPTPTQSPVLAQAATPPPTPTTMAAPASSALPIPTPTPGVRWGLIGGIVAAVVIIFLLIFFGVFRRRKPPHS